MLRNRRTLPMADWRFLYVSWFFFVFFSFSFFYCTVSTLSIVMSQLVLLGFQQGSCNSMFFSAFPAKWKGGIKWKINKHNKKFKKKFWDVLLQLIWLIKWNKKSENNPGIFFLFLTDIQRRIDLVNLLSNSGSSS